MAESFSREKLRQAPQKEGGWKNPVLLSSCVTPAGTSIEVQNEWEENTTTLLAYKLLFTQAPIPVFLDGTIIDISTILVTMYLLWLCWGMIGGCAR